VRVLDEGIFMKFNSMFAVSSAVAVLLISMLTVGGCTSTPRVVQSWKNPSVTGPLRFKKILVIAVYPDPTIRRIAEDELVQQIGPDRTVSASQVLTDADRGDREKIKAKVKQLGFDGVVTIRVAGATMRSETSGAFNPYSYNSFWQDYDNTMSAAEASRAETYSERVVSIRTRIFRVSDETLVWEGVTETFDAKDARVLVDDVVKAVVKRLREEHMIE